LFTTGWINSVPDTAQKSAFSKLQFKKIETCLNGEFSKTAEQILTKLSTQTADGLE